ncbi:MAG: lytic murein transglycosylase, partial [Mariprofundaceae bacterium]|nr:lytic murein transglycosylase [Mariprofundaceae bacterium]
MNIPKNQSSCSTLPRPDIERRRLLQGGLLGMVSLAFPRITIAMGALPSPIVPLTSKAELATQIKTEFNLPDTAIRPVLARAVFTPSVIERMRRPYEAKPYAQYRPLFVNSRLSGMGHTYISEHSTVFAQAMKQYGVQAEIIAAILGMETRYGRNRGRDKVLDALYTLATGYPKRAAFFRKELGNFILLCQEEHLQPDKVIGSYAGAFGTTQFIPSSYRAYAVDADGDGKRDVWNSTVDIINSVGNYFHMHGWDASRPVARWMPRLPRTASLEHL